MHKVNSWNEWDRLKTVIVGRVENARVPVEDVSLRQINYADLPSSEVIPSGLYPEQVIEETQEDLEALCRIFEEAEVKVLRPEMQDSGAAFGTPFWQNSGYYTFCPRDSALVHGSTIVECPMPLRSRYFENFSYHEIFKQAFLHGAKWISAPKMPLTDECYDRGPLHKDRLALTEHEPSFDAANVLRCGRDLFYLVSNSGNRLGARWLQSLLPDGSRVHLIEGVYSFMHLDSTISLLRPGLALLNPERLRADNIPPPLRAWDHIWCPEPVDIGYYGNYRHASVWIGMNLLMIRPDLALVEHRQLPLIRALEKHKINVIPAQLRHSRTLGGGFHCVTLDLEREGDCEDYFAGSSRP